MESQIIVIGLLTRIAFTMKLKQSMI